MRACGLLFGMMCAVALGQGAVAPAARVTATAGQVERKPSDTVAAQLVYRAAEMLRTGNLDDAQKQLDRAMVLNDEEPRLWSTYGYLHAAKGDKTGAVRDFRKEIALHPEVTEVYGTLADLEDGLGRRAEEEETLRKLLTVEARIPSAAARLMAMLIADGKAAEAVKVGQDASARFDAAAAADGRLDPRAGDGLKYALSKAQLAAGMKTESFATMVALMQVTTSGPLLNEGAYVLADAGVELPLAEKSARMALIQVELNSRGLTLATKPEVTRSLMEQIAAVWDTVGWVLFREGKLDDAESYVRAAWLQRQGVTVGEHLAEIEAARGDKNLALTVCVLSVAPPFAAEPAAGDAKLSAEDQANTDARAKAAAEDAARLRATADGLRKAGAVAKGPGVLREMLTGQMAPLLGVTGSGEFTALLGFGIIEAATSTSKANAPGMLSAMQGATVGVKVWPKDSGARLVMKASLTCKGASCVVVLADLD